MNIAQGEFLMNPWLFSFLVSLVLVILLMDLQRLKTNVYGGILSALFMQAENIISTDLELLEYSFVPLNMPDIYLFSNELNVFLTGIAFNMGILIARFHPRKTGYQLLHAFIWALFLIVFNLTAEAFGLINYIRFKPYFVVRQFLLFLFIAWIRNNFFIGGSGGPGGEKHGARYSFK